MIEKLHVIIGMEEAGEGLQKHDFKEDLRTYLLELVMSVVKHSRVNGR